MGSQTGNDRSKVAFAALHHPHFRAYFGTSLLSMMADNIEHVISYWVIFQAFHSPMLAGFAVISHWAPFLFLGVYLGGIADKYDRRKIIRVSQLVYMSASLTWGLLFLTDTLQVWHAVVLLSIHGLGGAAWTPASQLIIHDIVGREHLQSAIRLSATARHLSLLLGPAVGGGLMLALGPAVGLMCNALLFIPFALWLSRAPAPQSSEKRSQPRLGPMEAWRVMQEVAGNRNILSMVILVGLGALLVGSAFQAQLPQFALDLGADDQGVLYSILVASSAAGATAGGLLLEGVGWLRPRARTAIILATLWAVAMVAFAGAPNYPVGLATLFVAGFLNLTFSAMAQTLVQLEAPPDRRGRVMGLFNMSQLGLRTGSGFTVGVVGAFIGIHWSLALSAAALLPITISLLAIVSRRPVETPGLSNAEVSPPATTR